jgi:hypothetical protein
MKGFPRITLLGILFCLLGCQHVAEKKSPNNDDVSKGLTINPITALPTVIDLTAVTTEFFRLKNDHLLPGLDQETNSGNVSFFPVTEEIRRGDWYVALQKDYGQCKKSYYADVAISNRRLTYLFCLDSGRPELVAGLEEKNGLSYPIESVEAKPNK